MIHNGLQMNITDNEPPVEDIFNRTVTIVYIVLTSIIIFFGITLNILTIYIYNTGRIQQTNFNFCLVHLSIANIGEHIGFIPYMAVDLKEINEASSLLSNTFTCGVTEGISFFFISAFVEGFIVNYMAITRYRIIENPWFGLKINKQRSKIYFGIFWLIATVIMCPNFLTLKLAHSYGFCLRSYVIISKSITIAWSITIFMIGIIFPFLTICILYGMITFQLYNNEEADSWGGKLRFRYVTRNLRMIIVIFVVSWIPWGIYWLLSVIGYFGDGISADYKKVRIVRFVMLPCLSVGIINVITYGLVNSDFRKGIKTVFRRHQYDSDRYVRPKRVSSIKPKQISRMRPMATIVT